MKSHKLMHKRHKDPNLGDKTSVHSVTKTQSCEFKW